ncbi:transporter substrate-binding domain-containing protein [bacterium]|nr:transporter substrate-binding domain-containing protein [bacterium]MDC0303151.1 transporter substrate-binding domain-containing protein [bacterium]
MIRTLVLTGIVLISLPIQTLAKEVANELQIGVSGSPPFVIEEDGVLSGISVEIWKDVAERLEQPYKFVVQPNTNANVEAVADGSVDLAIGPISITPTRLANPKIDFTQPYYHGYEGLLIPQKPPGLITRLRPFIGWAALSSVGILITLLFIFGNLIWLAERRKNTEQFPRHYFHGVGNGMWFGLVTLTTVGYGDRAPLSRSGRIIAGIWMVISLVAVSSITAGLASAFTLSLAEIAPSAIREKADLRGKKIAVVEGTTSLRWGKLYEINAFLTKDLNGAIKILNQGKVEGIIFDEAPLRHYLKQNKKSKLKLANFPLAIQTYGFVLPMGSPLRNQLNIELLDMERNGVTERIKTKLLD